MPLGDDILGGGPLGGPVSIRITNVVNLCAGGDHKTISWDDEGTPREFNASLAEIDDMMERLLPGATVVEKKQLFLQVWGWYRRLQGRPIVGVDIA